MLNVELLRVVHTCTPGRQHKGIWKGGFGSDSTGTSYHPAVTVYRPPAYLLYLTVGLPHLGYPLVESDNLRGLSARRAFSDLRPAL
jgi:hypothetical protein